MLDANKRPKEFVPFFCCCCFGTVSNYSAIVKTISSLNCIEYHLTKWAISMCQCVCAAFDFLSFTSWTVCARVVHLAANSSHIFHTRTESGRQTNYVNFF